MSLRSGWVVLAASFVVLAFYRVVSTSFSILVLPLEAELGGSRASIAAIFTAHMLVYSAASLWSGIIIARIGPYLTIAVGGGFLGAGMALTAMGHSIAALTISFGLLCGIGIALTGLPASFAILSERFHGRIATAMGIAGMGTGLGVLLIVPAMQWTADRAGWRAAFLGTSVIIACLVTLCAAVLRASAAEGAGAPAAPPPPSSFRRVAEIVSSGAWQSFAGVNFLIGAALFGVLTELVAFLGDAGWSAIDAATILGLVNLLRSGSAPFWGMILDRRGRSLGYGLSTVLAVIGLASMAVLPFTPAASVLCAVLFTLGFGTGGGGSLPTNASLAAELFRPSERAIAWGLTDAAYAGGAALGSWMVGWLFDLTGNYAAALALSALELAVSYLVVLGLDRGRRVVAT